MTFYLCVGCAAVYEGAEATNLCKLCSSRVVPVTERMLRQGWYSVDAMVKATREADAR